MTSLRQRASFRLHSTGSMSTLESSGKILVMKKADGEKGREGFGRVATDVFILHLLEKTSQVGKNWRECVEQERSKIIQS